MKQTTSKETETDKALSVVSENDQQGEKKTKDSNISSQQTQDPPMLEKFFISQLKDIYYAEEKLTKAIPKMVKAASTEQLQEAFEDHLHQTQKQIKRLDKVFKLLGRKAEGEKCEAIEGIVKEAEKIIEETEDGTMTRDAALIMAAQKVEHYEIATYGGLVQFAITLGLHEIADLLDQTLLEEEDTDRLLTDIAESYINIDAEKEGNNYSWNKKQQNETQPVVSP